MCTRDSIYTNEDTVSVGIVATMSEVIKQDIPVYQMLENFKNRPEIAPVIRGGKLVEYSGHVVPEGGLKMMPELVGNGVIVAGDADVYKRQTEGHAIMSTSDRHLEHALSDTQVRGSDVNTRNSEGVHSNFHALTALTKHELRIDLNVGELQTSVARTTAAHHVRHRNEFEAREAHVNEECGEALVAFFVRVSYADNVRELRAVGVGDEPLFTIEDPFALLFVPNCGGVQVSTSATSLLGKSEVGAVSYTHLDVYKRQASTMRCDFSSKRLITSSEMVCMGAAQNESPV